jgi:mannose-6-phosphate isomerase
MSDLEKSERPWGRYEVLQETSTHKVKCIWLNPSSRLSYQRHKHRAEHWLIIKGFGEVTIDGKVSKVATGDTVDFAAGVLHRLTNTGTEEIVFVEVQTGSYFGEDDIERLEDDFGRA